MRYYHSSQKIKLQDMTILGPKHKSRFIDLQQDVVKHIKSEINTIETKNVKKREILILIKM